MIRRIVAALSLLLWLGSPSLGEPKNWIQKEKERIEVDVDKLKNDEARAQDAIDQAREAARKSAELHDEASASISRQALEAAENALKAARVGLARLSAKIAAFNAAERMPETRAVLGRGQGDVSAMIDGKWTVLSAQTRILPGMRIKTGSKS